MLNLYSPGHSFIHRMRPGLKTASLMVSGTALFLVSQLWIMVGATLLVLLLYRLAGFGLRTIQSQLRPLMWIFLALFLVQLLIANAHGAIFVVLRLATLILAASLVTLTTRSSDMIEAITRGLGFLRPLGVNSAKVGLAFSLVLRFIPVLASITCDVREAQKARGLERSVLAVALPVAVRTLKMADEITDAIEARGYAP